MISGDYQVTSLNERASYAMAVSEININYTHVNLWRHTSVLLKAAV